MNMEKLQFLMNIYNELLLVSTNGNNSFIMVDNLRKLQKFIIQEEKELREGKEDEPIK